MIRIEENYQRITDDRRSFDIRFWQSQGGRAIFEAVTDVLHEYFWFEVKMLTSFDFKEQLNVFKKQEIRYPAKGI